MQYALVIEGQGITNNRAHEVIWKKVLREHGPVNGWSSATKAEKAESFEKFLQEYIPGCKFIMDSTRFIVETAVEISESLIQAICSFVRAKWSPNIQLKFEPLT
jgi:hypothetical protein